MQNTFPVYLCSSESSSLVRREYGEKNVYVVQKKNYKLNTNVITV